MDLEQFARDEMISKSRKINNYEKLSFEVKRFQPKSCDIPKFQIGHKRNGRTASTTWLQEAACAFKSGHLWHGAETSKNEG